MRPNFLRKTKSFSAILGIHPECYLCISSCAAYRYGSIAWKHPSSKMKNMSYTKNPYLPRVRRDAADLVRRGWGVRKTVRR